MLHYWPWLVLGNAVVTVIIVSLVGWWALSRVLDRMRASRCAQAGCLGRQRSGRAVPVRLECVRFRYPGTDHDALPRSACR
ncbi:transmembrane ATP-binding ABC transporter domain protein [Mycobacterium xenopi 3993]|nr:transmembrane ATP-binding ABC transporter domain protein [Mycobacterium xenopi 3993]